MTLITFPFIEHYLLWMAGITNINGQVISLPALAQQSMLSQLSFANYDVSFVYSTANQVAGGTSLTDSQFNLAAKIITKYKRQLAKCGIGVPIEYKAQLGIRIIDRTKKVWLDNDKIKISFPFQDKLIDALRTARNENAGDIYWSTNDRLWYMALTESNVSWVVAFAATYNFHVTEDVLILFEQIAEVEKIPHKIELVRENNEYSITNAHNTLTEYITPFINNKYELIDHCGVLGYTVSKELVDEIKKEHGDLSWVLCQVRRSHIKPTLHSLQEIVDWARTVNRLPIVVYDATLKVESKLDLITACSDKVKVFKSKKDLTLSTEIYYTDKVIDIAPKLLISFSTMIFGQKRAWVDQFEKVIYYSEQIIT